jgi:hypothetical protein
VWDTIGLDEALLVDDGQALFSDSGRIVSLVSEVEGLEPAVDVFDVLGGSLFGDHTLDHSETISSEIYHIETNQSQSTEYKNSGLTISEVSIVRVLVENIEDGGTADLARDRVDGHLCCLFWKGLRERGDKEEV